MVRYFPMIWGGLGCVCCCDLDVFVVVSTTTVFVVVLATMIVASRSDVTGPNNPLWNQNSFSSMTGMSIVECGVITTELLPSILSSDE